MNGIPWTQEEMDLLERLYPNYFAGEIQKHIHRSKSSIYYMAKRMGLQCTPEKISRSGRMSAHNPNVAGHRFKKGHIPANKGKKISPETYAKCAPTMFKKGRESLNKRPVGSERVNVDGYIEIKVAEPNRWRLKNRVVWEQHHGSIPPGCNIQFKDHNPLNCTIDNLYLITRAEQMGTQNSYMARYPKELADIIRLKGAVKRQINKAQRNGKQ